MPKKKSKISLAKPKKPAPKKVIAKKSKLIRDKVLGFILLCLALVVLLIPQSTFSPKKEMDKKNPITIDKKLLESKKSEDMPIRIIAPKVDIDIKITPSKVIDGYWEISEQDASYGLGSGLPGTASNTVIFAHAREGLFYNLKDIKKDDIIYVFTKNKWHRYKVNEIIAIFPDQKEVILPTKKETLTLYTCTGFNDEKRLVVIAIPS